MAGFIDQFKDNPDHLRGLDDFMFDQICDFVSMQYEPLFHKGLGWVPHDPNSDEVRVQVVDGQHKDKEIVCRLESRERVFLCIVAEELLIRTFEKLSMSMLADMLVNRTNYQSIWESFGEYAVFEKQLVLSINRDRLRNGNTASSNVKQSEKDVNGFRQKIAENIATGEIKPQSTKDINKLGFELFGKHYKTTEGAAIGGLAVRFRSKLGFATDTIQKPRTPYQFSLGYVEPKPMDIDLAKIGLLGKEWEEFEATVKAGQAVKVMTLELATSPTLAPDMKGWTPKFV